MDARKPALSGGSERTPSHGGPLGTPELRDSALEMR